MKKLVKLLSIIALSASTALWSCKGDQGEVGPKGDTGAAGVPGVNGTNGTNGKDGKDGVNGTNGKDGNANVVSFQVTVKPEDFKEVDVSGIGSGVTSKWGAVAVQNALVSTDKFVMVFVKNVDQLKALPITFTKDLDNSLERLDYGYKTGQVEIFYRYQTNLFGGTTTLKPGQDLTFDIVVTSKTTGALLEKSGVDTKNYDSVMNFLSTSL
jgi:hypothetical protein